MSKKGNITFTIIKPGAVENGHTGAILDRIIKSGFSIAAMKLVRMSRKDAEEFYSVHRERPFFSGLVDFMTSGPVVVAILEKENAVADYRKLIGATDPDQAEDGTLRKLYAESIQKNAVHGSDSEDNALMESNFFFSRRERFTKQGDFLAPTPCKCC